MGMFSEAGASANCRDYEDMLLKAIESQDPNVIKYAKEVIFPKYCYELGEAFEKRNEIIDKYYGN